MTMDYFVTDLLPWTILFCPNFYFHEPLFNKFVCVSNCYDIAGSQSSLFINIYNGNFQHKFIILLAHGEVYQIQHYVMKFVSDLPQVGGFLQVLHHDLTEILLKTVLNTINLATLFPSAEGAVVVMIIWQLELQLHIQLPVYFSFQTTNLCNYKSPRISVFWERAIQCRHCSPSIKNISLIWTPNIFQ